MSVPEFLRKSRTMQVYIKARNILNHTRKILSSEKNIPKRHRHDYADRLDNEATEMFLCVSRANAIHPTTHEDYVLRRDYLTKAKTHIYPLRQGIKFLRWRYILTNTGKVVRRMDRRSVTRERRKIKKLGAKVGDGVLPERKLTESYQSWRAHARQGNTRSIVYQMDRLYCAIMQKARRRLYQHEQNHRTRAGSGAHAATGTGGRA